MQCAGAVQHSATHDSSERALRNYSRTHEEHRRSATHEERGCGPAGTGQMQVRHSGVLFAAATRNVPAATAPIHLNFSPKKSQSQTSPMARSMCFPLTSPHLQPARTPPPTQLTGLCARPLLHTCAWSVQGAQAAREGL